MYNNQKIGVGLFTYNRKELFKCLFDIVRSIDYIDEICIVKNKDIDYGDIFERLPYNVKYINVKDDLGIGYCKNQALLHFLNTECDHIFLIEDDIKIKNNDVFKVYIDTAKSFNLQHLIFGAVYTPPSWQIDEIVDTVRHNDYSIDMYKNLHGGFVYFTKKCIQYCGLFDECYINAVEHIDHTYRIIKFGFYTPFWAFADIHDSRNYLADLQPENPSTINNNVQRRQRVITGMMRFANTWNIQIRDIPRPYIHDIHLFLNQKIQH